MTAAQLLVAACLATPVIALAVLTGIGGHRRGNSRPLIVIGALVFPIAWIAWYVHDLGRPPFARRPHTP